MTEKKNAMLNQFSEGQQQRVTLAQVVVIHLVFDKFPFIIMGVNKQNTHYPHYGHV